MPEKYYKLIKDTNLFSSMAKDEVKALIKNRQFIIKSYKRGSIIHLEDEECSRIEVILSGEVVIENLDEDGNLLTITDFRTGDMLGGNLIFSSNPRYPMTITALSDSVLLLLSKEMILELSKKNSDFLKNYLRLISDNTYILSTKIKTNINKSLKEKIIIFLTHQQNIQDTDMVKLNMTKKRLAEKLGVQRTSLSRELKKMQDEGFIDFGRDYIHIKRLK